MEKSNNAILILALVVVFIVVGLIIYSNNNKPVSTVVDGALLSTNLDIIENANKLTNLSTAVALIDSADLTATLKSIGPYTVFFPSNSAFDKLTEGTLDSLLQPENISNLSTVLTYHVVAGKYTSDMLVDGQELYNINGQRMYISKKSGSFTVNGAMVESKDIVSKNGVVFIIDTVLTPSSETLESESQKLNIIQNIEQASNLTILIETLNSADLSQNLETEGPFTIFAPTNTAFDRLSTGTLVSLLEPENKSYLVSLLNNHVLQGEYTADDLGDGTSLQAMSGLAISISKSDNSFKVNGGVVISEIRAKNGVIFIVDKVLTPQ